MAHVNFLQDRELDAIVLGRAGVDLYAREANTDIAEVTGFDKYVGGLLAVLQMIHLVVMYKVT